MGYYLPLCIKACYYYSISSVFLTNCFKTVLKKRYLLKNSKNKIWERKFAAAFNIFPLAKSFKKIILARFWYHIDQKYLPYYIFQKYMFFYAKKNICSGKNPIFYKIYCEIFFISDYAEVLLEIGFYTFFCKKWFDIAICVKEKIEYRIYLRLFGDTEILLYAVHYSFWC